MIDGLGNHRIAEATGEDRALLSMVLRLFPQTAVEIFHRFTVSTDRAAIS